MTPPSLPSTTVSNESPSLTSLEHKLLGTQQLSLSNLPLALHHYTLALLLSPPTPSLLIPLHLNLALTHLRIGTSPRLALASASKALELGVEGAQREKASFRAGQACYSLELWDQAEEMLEKMEKGGKERKEWLIKVERRKRERDGGEFDWFGMMLGGSKGGYVRVADFVGPVEVVETEEGKGRGLVATRDIEEGELMLCVKPFASVLEEDLDSTEKIKKEGAVSPITDLVDSITQVKLATRILERIKDEPLSAAPLNLLFAGPTFDSLPPFPLSALLPDPASDPTGLPSQPTLRQISLAISYNSFTPRSLASTALLPPTPSAHPPSALYLLPSLLNHSCLPNTSWTFYSPSSGSPLAIRSRTLIKKGEEITQSYCSGLDFDARRVVLEKHLPPSFSSSGRGCGCDLCSSEHDDGIEGRERRRSLLRVLKEELMGNEPSEGGVKSLENLAEAMGKTYRHPRKDEEGERRELRPDMWEVYHQLSDQLSYLVFHPSSSPRSDASERKEELARRSIEAEISALRSCGATFGGPSPTTGSNTSPSSPSNKSRTTLPQPPFLTLPVAREEACVGSCFVVASVWEMLGEQKLARRWMEEGRRVERVLVGGDADDKVWRKRWSGVGREYGVDRYL